MTDTEYPLLIPAAAKLLITYPFVYAMLDAIVCAPYGKLDMTHLQCACPVSRIGRACEICAVRKTHGKCLQSTVSCYDKWMGPTCTICPACPGNDTTCDDCSGECNNDQHWYNSPDTNKCRFCNSSVTCSNNGVCNPVDGTCKCNPGFAGPASGIQGADCSLQCPGLCSNRGTCTAGGICSCDEPFCGPRCEYDMSYKGDGQYCSSAGFANIATGQQADVQCECQCFTNPSAALQAFEPVAYGPRCERTCPIGTGGDVCGTTGSPVDTGSQCLCQCKDGLPRATTCDTVCKLGSRTTLSGECECLYENQLASEYCAECKHNWWHAELGCTAYCGDETCVHGTCSLTSTGVACDQCGGNYDPVIQDIVESLGETFLSTAQFTLDLNGIALGFYDKRILTIDSITPSTAAPVHDTDSPTIQVLRDDQSTAIILPHGATQYTSLAITSHQLETPIPIAIDHTLYELTLALEYNALLGGFNVSRYTDMKPLCIASSVCIAYNNRRKELYSCIQVAGSNKCAGVTQAAENGTVVIMTRVRLPEIAQFKMRVVDTLLRGCATCLPNHYPAPSLVTENSCTIMCTRASSCNNLGNCTEYGTCVCDYPHLDADRGCFHCDEHYFPHPDEHNGTSSVAPCQNICVSEATEDPGGGYCSGHGVCGGDGSCMQPCAPAVGAEPNGWSGEHCNIACNANSNDTDTICSGHGTCDNNRCICDENYLGELCDVTCNLDQQWFYVDEHDGNSASDRRVCDGIKDGCEENVECGEEGSTCTRIKCNGAKCEGRFQYIHLNTTINYQMCSTRTDNNTLLECTGWTPEEYTALNITATKIRREHGIYCEVGGRNDHKGFCRRAYCNCGDMENVNQITSAGDGSSVVLAEAAQPLAGEGCQVVGCSPAEFADSGSYSSYCGIRPPILIADPVAMYDAYPTTEQVQEALYLILTEKTQHCSHGACMAFAGQPGTKERAAPAGARGVRGKCFCRSTPSVSETCQNTDGPLWAQQCCQTQIGGESPYFGRTCMDQCICSQSKWWRGTCAGDDTGKMALGCNCRAGYTAEMQLFGQTVPGRSTPRNELFCGATCKAQCKGVITANGTHLASNDVLSHYCPDASPTTEAHSEGCYNGFLPCTGHGTCAASNGACHYQNDRQGNCKCWGSEVSTETVNAHPLLPNTVLMYGGEDCNVPCPGAENMDQFFTENYDALHVANHKILDSHKALKQEFFNRYNDAMCNGHGYCGISSSLNVHDGMLRCTCTGNFGGVACDKQCKLDVRAWGDRLPIQSKNNNATADDPLGNYLQQFYGLSKCGPNAKCDDEGNYCVATDTDAYLTRQTYTDGLASVARMVKKEVSDETVSDFFSQWAMAFVGEFATCSSGYYSSKQLEQTNIMQNDHYIFDLPKLVRWQLSRSCNAFYSQNTASEQGGPWCCTYPVAGTAWRDDTSANFGANTHGGCPDTYCPNFATGRQCTDCISTAFTTWGTVNTCPVQGSGPGKCSICAGGLDEHFVYPYISAAASSVPYTVNGRPSCEHCISHAREKSGEQLYALASDVSRVCNKHGKCMGKVNTYSGIDDYPHDVVDAPQGASLLCEQGMSPHYQLGQCLCDEGWEGPTCAMPTLESSCGIGGKLTSIGRISPHHSTGQPYNYCKCDQPDDSSTARAGHYCMGSTTTDNIYGFASAELMPCQSIQLIMTGSSITPTLVECNDPSGKSPCDAAGLCQTCADTELDPDALCIEYKHSGTGGIVAAHVARVKARAQC